MISIEPAISVITRIELFASARIPEQERLILEAFVSISTLYDTINSGIIAQAIAIRKQHKTKLPDAIIAATALVYSLTLISRITSDFRIIQGLQFIDPYML